MKYHILTPFSRGQNQPAILENFHRPNVVFYPIMENCHYYQFPREDWIKPFTYDRDPGIKRIWFHAINKFLEANTLAEEDYYLYLADDDFMEPGFLKKLRGINTNFILVSMKRGDHITASRYGTNTLVPHWRFMSRSRIAFEQLLIKGKILQNERLRDHISADGQFIGSLRKRFSKEHFTFVLDAFIWFNYLEPGRWDGAPIPTSPVPVSPA